ncbi:hypothetical protein ACIQHY_12930 [Streptomyces sp. NPDC092359]|uniref:hypothetical protein n=1 Tax=Streptomyces sp. NPDC092359 TaxID=3366014 RepID=UPI00381B4792
MSAQPIMPTSSPGSPASPENRRPEATDHLAWRRHIPALAAAVAGIRQASDAWDAVSDSFCDTDGWPVDEQGYEEDKVKRDAEAWRHVEVFLDHGPEVLADVRAAARSADYAEGPVSEDLRWLRGIDATLEHAGRLQREWDQTLVIMEASMPGSRQLYEGRAQEERNADGWHYADELAIRGPALVRATDHLSLRANTEQPVRARAALARSTPGLRGALPASPPPAPAPGSPAPGRSR